MSRVLPALLSVAAMTAASPAMADVPTIAGDVALTYGRNLGQGLNVAGLAVEAKGNVHPQVSVGIRPFLEFGAGASSDESGVQGNAFFGAGVTAKGEFFLTESRVRPYAGLGLGLESIGAAGGLASVDDSSASTEGWESSGVAPVVMPEVGIDLAILRLALLYRAPIGAKGSGVVSSVNAQGESSTETVDGPHLGGLLFQVGLHFGGPKK